MSTPTASQLQERTRAMRDAWEAAPASLRDWLLTLHDTPFVVRSKRSGEEVQGYYALANGFEVSSRQPTEPELLWLRAHALHDVSKTLQTLEWVRVMYERLPTKDLDGTVKAPLQAVTFAIDLSVSYFHTLTAASSSEYIPCQQRSHTDLPSCLRELRGSVRDWKRWNVVPDPYQPQIDLFEDGLFGQRYRGLGVILQHGIVTLDVHVPERPWEDLP